VTEALDVVIAHESRPKRGESANGDLVVVERHPSGILVAIVDALGHGPRAEAVAKLATDYFAGVAAGFAGCDAEGLMGGLHAALRGTRGAAATLCVIRGARLEACGVGNVEMRCVGASIPVTLCPGIVGVQLRKLRSFSGTLVPKARCFLFSDGVSRRAPFAELSRLSPKVACSRLILQHRHEHDDASVALVAVEERV